MAGKSIYQFFKRIVDGNRDKTAYRYKKDGQWLDVSWVEHEKTCQQISKSLMALGADKGDKIDILSQTRLEWVQCDIATVSIGSVIVGIYPSNLAQDCAYIIDHSDAVLIFVENQEQLDKVLKVRDDLPKLKHIVMIDGEPAGADDVMTWQAFLEKGKDVSGEDFMARVEAVEPQDLASLVYTSGTTGVPKGVMLTHGNLLFTSEASAACLYIEDDYETILFLPLAHVFARIIVYSSMQEAATLSFGEGLDKIAGNIREVRPHFFASVPRIYEKIHEKITSGAADASGLKKKIFDWALKVGYQVSRLQQQKKPVPGLLAFKHNLADKLVFSKIKEALGGRVHWCISGAAPLNKEIAEFFHACGILILEGIGMTENTSFSNINRIDNFKFGTVGILGEGVEMKIAADGEVLYRGKNVMQGYYKNPQATAETIDEDGWLYTGDIGEVDADGFLKITDRKKDLIITAGGKNVAPQRIEKIMTTSRYISQAVAYGDKRKYLVAAVTLDQEQVELWAKQKGVANNGWEGLCRDREVFELINGEIQEKNRQLPSYETLKKFTIITRDFSIEGGELTPTLKIKRKVVFEKYGADFEALYDD